MSPPSSFVRRAHHSLLPDPGSVIAKPFVDDAAVPSGESRSALLFWVAEAHRAFEWFLGRNDLGLALYDSSTGGCRDGLHVDRVSENQGAESTLAFLLALAEMQALQSALTSFEDSQGKLTAIP
ncbi:MAG: hypothetical protein HYY06_31900 [Deltaproteobacteria bacterium]|nr:hypothetical protein [Deltaproteobacteria bacterium]